MKKKLKIRFDLSEYPGRNSWTRNSKMKKDNNPARTWVCGGCGQTIKVTYEELAESGNPMCVKADCGCYAEMTLTDN